MILYNAKLCVHAWIDQHFSYNYAVCKNIKRKVVSEALYSVSSIEKSHNKLQATYRCTYRTCCYRLHRILQISL